MRFSYSKVQTYTQCPYKFKLRYIDKLETLPDYDPQSPLILGSALHLGIEKDINAAREFYFNSYPVITDVHINEMIKLEYWLPKIKELLPEGEHEVEIKGTNFIGFIDLLVPVDENTYDLYDFKYSNNVDRYMESGQLHLYRYVYELIHPDKKIRDMYFLFVPKSSLRMKRKNKRNKRDETLHEFRKRTLEDLQGKELQLVKVDYDKFKVKEFLDDCETLRDCEDYIKNPTRLCDWCEYQAYCEKGDNLDMVLPSTKRREIEVNGYKKLWIYGLPFTGKTYLANQFDTPLMLNTDGNFKQVDAPVIRIIDEVTTEGRLTKRKYAWEVFKETVDELEKGSEFKTIIVDLLEDAYDACRVKVCVDNGWDHESDDSFKAYDIVRSEFLRTLKRLLNLDYNIVIISHEDTSRDIMKKSGDKITAIKPNINEKIALKVAGMVDIACRIINENGKRTISFKSSDVEFGGGRLGITAKEIPCEYKELMKVYNEKPKAQESGSNEPENTENEDVKTTDGSKEVETAVAEPAAEMETPEETPKRTRKPKEVVEDAKEEAEAQTPEAPEEAPVRRKRKRGEE